MEKIKQIFHNKKLRVLILFAVVAIVAFSIFLLSKDRNTSFQRISDTAQAKLYLTPATGTQFANNSSANVDVMLDTLGKDVTGVLVEIQYDNTKLTLDSIEKTGSAFGEDNVTLNPSLTANKLRIVADKPEDNPVTGNEKKIATLKFTTKANGTAKIEFTSNSIVETVVSGQSTNIPTDKQNADYIIGDSSVTAVPSITGPTLPPTESRCLPYGDVDENNTVNNADLSLVEKYINKEIKLKSQQLLKADINRSNTVNKQDYDLLKQIVDENAEAVFPGNPPVCPPEIPHISVGFSNQDVVLDETVLTPTKNKLLIYNPKKRDISYIQIGAEFNSSVIRVTSFKPLQSTLSSPNSIHIGDSIFSGGFIPSNPTSELIELAEFEVVPYTLSNSLQTTLTITDLVVTEQVDIGAVNAKATDKFATADYTVVRSRLTQAPTTGAPITSSPPVLLTNPPETPTPINASPPVGGASVKITATIPAVGTTFASDNKNPIEPNRQVQIQLTNSTSNAPITASGTLTFNGNAYVGYVLIPTITQGNYQIKARLNNTLYKTIPGIYNLQDTSSVNTSTVALNSGDINQDNKIDIYDYNIILGCVQKKSSCTASLRSLSDLDSNGLTDKGDYNIFLTQLAFREGD